MVVRKFVAAINHLIGWGINDLSINKRNCDQHGEGGVAEMCFEDLQCQVDLLFHRFFRNMQPVGNLPMGQMFLAA